MTETVDFRLEQSLPELQDLVSKELVTLDEVRAIVKHRSQHEHTLLRRTVTKADFLRYIQYEQNLEALRQKRRKRQKDPGKKSISDYAGPRRIRNIFQRAVTRFPEIELWIQYIEYSKSLDSPKLTGKLFGDALQKFPSSAELWIMAAQYEFNKNANMTGARNLLLRSLRLNAEKHELWLEYARLECLFLLKIMERRRILGLDKEETTSVEDDVLEFHKRDEIQLPVITAEDLEDHREREGVKLDPMLTTSPLADVATNPALNGAIPLAVYDSAVGTRPEDISLATGFYDVFAPFYSGLQFIDAALNKVKAHLEEKFPGRGRTVLIQIKDHARGIDVTDKKFPGVLREMMKTANTMQSLPMKERKDCGAGLQKYLDTLLDTHDLDENLRKAVEIFRGKVAKWQDITDM